MKQFLRLCTPFQALILSIVLFIGAPAVNSSPSNAPDSGDSNTLTLNDVARVSAIASMSVSPDGKWVAYVRTVQRTPYDDEDGAAWGELHITDTKGNSRPFITGDVNIKNVQWSADSKTVYYLAKRGEDKYTSLYSIPVDGGESVQVYAHKTDISGYSLSADGSQALILATEPDPEHVEKLSKKGFKAKVYEENLHYSNAWMITLTGDNRKAKMLNIEGHVLDIQFSNKGGHLLAKISKTPLVDDIFTTSKVTLLDNKGNKLATLNDDGKVGAGKWSPNNKSVAFIGTVDQHDPMQGRLKFRNDINSRTIDLLPNLMGHVTDIAFLPKGDILALNHIGTGSEIAIVNPEKPGKSKRLNIGDLVAHKLSVPANARGFAFTADSATHPMELFWYQSGKVKRLTDSNPWLSRKELGKQEVITYNARDGLKIEGVLVYPVDYQKGKRYPLINFIHGGPEGHRSNGWNTRYSEPAQVASAKGYFSFYPNYRGSTGRGVEFSKADQHGYATPEFDDIVDGKDHLIKLGLVDSQKVGITGGSYGGYATAWSATALSEHYAAAVMFVGISNQLSKFGTTDIANEMFLVHSRAWPWDDFQWMLERSPVYHAQKHRTPLLIAHGDSDTRVHPSQSMEMYRYLKTLNNAPVRLVFYPGEGHGNRKAAARLDFSKRLMRWMDHYLQGPGGEPPAYDLKHEEHLKQNKEDNNEDS